MRGAAVAVDRSWGDAASLPGDALNVGLNLREALCGRSGEENPLNVASITRRLQKQVDAARDQYEQAKVPESALYGAITEMEVALTEISGDDNAVVEAVRSPDKFEAHLQRRAGGRRKNVDEKAVPFFDDLIHIVAEEFIRLAPGSRSFDVAALKQLLEWRTEITELLVTIIEKLDSHLAQAHSDSPTRVRFGSRPMVTAGFVDREEQDELFDTILTQVEGRTVLTGMRGSGKTQLAAAVAAKCEDEDWPVVAWINAASRADIVSDLYELAVQSGIDASQDHDRESIIRRYLNKLHSEDDTDCLFVFDNVENFNDLTDLTPHGEYNSIRIIATTTRHLADWNDWHPIPVNVFKREQSITLLCERTSQPDRDTANHIADVLGDLPLAIIQAVSTILRGRLTLAEYLDKLNNSSLEGSIKKREVGNYRDTVAVTLFMAHEQTLEDIRRRNPAGESIAPQILGILSLLAAPGIPSHWLRNINDNPEDTQEALTSLLESSICQESTDKSQISLHRLQSQVFRENYMNTPKQLQDACDNTISLLTSVARSSSPSTEQGQRDISSLLDQLHIASSQPHSQHIFQNEKIVSLISLILDRLRAPGAIPIPYDLISPIDVAIKSLASTNPEVLTLRADLADLFLDIGDNWESNILQSETYGDHIKLFGPDSEKTLRFLHRMAENCCWHGDTENAAELFQIALPKFKEILGDNHPLTLSAQEHLGHLGQWL